MELDQLEQLANELLDNNKPSALSESKTHCECGTKLVGLKAKETNQCAKCRKKPQSKKPRLTEKNPSKKHQSKSFDIAKITSGSNVKTEKQKEAQTAGLKLMAVIQAASTRSSQFNIGSNVMIDNPQYKELFKQLPESIQSGINNNMAVGFAIPLIRLTSKEQVKEQEEKNEPILDYEFECSIEPKRLKTFVALIKLVNDIADSNANFSITNESITVNIMESSGASFVQLVLRDSFFQSFNLSCSQSVLIAFDVYSFYRMLERVPISEKPLSLIHNSGSGRLDLEFYAGSSITKRSLSLKTTEDFNLELAKRAVLIPLDVKFDVSTKESLIDFCLQIQQLAPLNKDLNHTTLSIENNFLSFHTQEHDNFPSSHIQTDLVTQDSPNDFKSVYEWDYLKLGFFGVKNKIPMKNLDSIEIELNAGMPIRITNYFFENNAVSLTLLLAPLESEEDEDEDDDFEKESEQDEEFNKDVKEGNFDEINASDIEIEEELR